MRHRYHVVHVPGVPRFHGQTAPVARARQLVGHEGAYFHPPPAHAWVIGPFGVAAFLARWRVRPHGVATPSTATGSPVSPS